MVTGWDVSKDIVRKLSGGRYLEIHKFLKKRGKVNINLNKRNVEQLIAKIFLASGLSKQEAAAAAGIDPKQVPDKLRVTKGFRVAMELLGNPVLALRHSCEYGYNYSLAPSIVELVIIEDLIMAGWNNRQIAKATGFHIRRIQRARKKLREDEYYD